MNKAVPGLELQIQDVGRIFAGLLPTTVAGSNKLTKREVIIDHGAAGGPTGLYSVGGIKFTTARLVAEKILALAGLGKPILSMPKEGSNSYVEISKGQQFDQYRELLDRDKSIVHLDDLLLRRSTLWEEGEDALKMAERLCELFSWDDERKKQELEKCKACLEDFPQGIRS